MKHIPDQGIAAIKVLEKLESLKREDIDWKRGRNFAYVYHPGDEIADVVKQAYLTYISENALNPTNFPSLKEMENSVLSMSAHLLHGDDEVQGSMTTGGTESIMMTVFTARQYARSNKPAILKPNIVVPKSVHPAFHKAGHYFDVEIKSSGLRNDFAADVSAMESLIDENTIMIVGSAPAYPHGVMDPIAEIAELAIAKGLLCHVDACIGGFILPFLRMSGIGIPGFDFAVPGVTSISTDIHKYGYAAKGASVILYKSAALRRHQYYAYTEWNGGIYVSPTMTGTRPGGAIAAAYAAMTHIGLDGYQRLSLLCYDTTQTIKTAILGITDIHLIGNPCASLFAIGSNTINIYQVGDELSVMGWSIDRQQLPPSLHLSINPTHAGVVDEFIADLKEAVKKASSISLSKVSAGLQVGVVKGLKKMLSPSTFEKFQSYAGKHSDGESKRTAALYGIIGELQGEGELDDMVIDMLGRMFDQNTSELSSDQ